MQYITKRNDNKLKLLIRLKIIYDEDEIFFVRGKIL